MNPTEETELARILPNLFLCAFALPAMVERPQEQPADPSTSSDTHPLGEFDRVWRLVRDHFFDPKFNGVDWDAARQRFVPQAKSAASLSERAAVINRMLAELKTSHTHFYTRLDIEYYHLFDIFKAGPLGDEIRRRFLHGTVAYSGIGVFTTEIDDRIFIKGVMEGGPGHRAGLQPGQRILSVDNRPFHPTESFEGKAGRPVIVKIQYAAEAEAVREVAVEPQRIEPTGFMLNAMRESVKIIERDEKKIGYIHVWSYAGLQYHQLLTEEVRFGRLREADALVLDLRDGWGGANTEYLNLFNHRVPVFTHIMRDGTRRVMDPQWRRPVALLINGGTRSGKEAFTYGFKKFGYGPVVGTRTAGAVTGGRLFLIGDDAVLFLAVLDTLIDGERLEGKGVAPDIEVAFPIEYANGKDPQLERAIEILLKRLTKP